MHCLSNNTVVSVGPILRPISLIFWIPPVVIVILILISLLIVWSLITIIEDPRRGGLPILLGSEDVIWLLRRWSRLSIAGRWVILEVSIVST